MENKKLIIFFGLLCLYFVTQYITRDLMPIVWDAVLIMLGMILQEELYG